MSLALPAPRLIDPEGVPHLRWGVIGTGDIADGFVTALHGTTPQRAVAVAARDAAKTERFAASHGIERALTSVDQVVGSTDVDVVYIATPHPRHKEAALAAIAAGKHVLVEKPIAMDAADAREIVAAARAAGVLLMEAMWTRYLPQYDVLRQVLADGLVGDVHLVTADFGFVAPDDPAHRLWNPELGGGALLDVGVYPLSFASSVLGAPTRVVATGALGSTGVDARASLLLEHASGAPALVSASISSRLPTVAAVTGSAGRVELHSPFFAPSGVTLTVGDETASWDDSTPAPASTGLAFEATALASYVAEGRTESPLHGLDEVVSTMETIDEARRQIAEASGR